MKIALPAAAALLSLSATAQVTEIPNMSVQFSTVIMDNLPVGTTTLQAIRAAGDNGGAPIAALEFLPNSASNGFYNVNIAPYPNGRALALNQQDQLAILAPSSFFNSFDLAIDLEVPATEFGIGVSDWLQAMVLDFYLNSRIVGSVQSSDYITAAPKFFRAPSAFDRVEIRAESIFANWLVASLYIQNFTSWAPFGDGCAGSNGVPELRLVAQPVIGQNFVLDVINLPQQGAGFLMVTGTSDTFSPQVGNLPFELSGAGAPGCFVLCDNVASRFQIATGPTGTYTLNLPSDPLLVGFTFFNQAYIVDATANTLGGTVSNAGRAIVQ